MNSILNFGGSNPNASNEYPWSKGLVSPRLHSAVIFIGSNWRAKFLRGKGGRHGRIFYLQTCGCFEENFNNTRLEHIPPGTSKMNGFVSFINRRRVWGMFQAFVGVFLECKTSRCGLSIVIKLEWQGRQNCLRFQELQTSR